MPGLSFSPFNQPSGQQPPGQAAAPVQDAIKVLSFRMPSVVGGGAPAPGALLGGQSGLGGSLQGGLFQNLLQRLLGGQMGAGGGMPGTGPMGMPPGGPGLGATNPFAAPPPAPTGAPSLSGLNPSIQFGGGPGLPRSPDPNAPPQDGGYTPPGTTPGWLPPGTAQPPDVNLGQPNPNPVSTMPMPRSPDMGGGGQPDFGGWVNRMGGAGMGGRF